MRPLTAVAVMRAGSSGSRPPGARWAGGWLIVTVVSLGHDPCSVWVALTGDLVRRAGWTLAAGMGGLLGRVQDLVEDLGRRPRPPGRRPHGRGAAPAPTTAGQRPATRPPCSVLHTAAPPGAAQRTVTRVQFGACPRCVAFPLRREMTSAPPKPPSVVHIEVLGPG